MNATVKLQRVDYLKACWLFNAKVSHGRNLWN